MSAIAKKSHILTASLATSSDMPLTQAQAPNTSLRLTAHIISSVLRIHSQLYGWQHAADFIRDPAKYKALTQAHVSASVVTAATTAATGTAPLVASPGGNSSEFLDAVTSFLRRGRSVIARLVFRVEWLMEVLALDPERKSNPNDPLNIDLILNGLSRDDQFLTDGTQFITECDAKLNTILKKNETLFAQFRT